MFPHPGESGEWEERRIVQKNVTINWIEVDRVLRIVIYRESIKILFVLSDFIFVVVFGFVFWLKRIYRITSYHQISPNFSTSRESFISFSEIPAATLRCYLSLVSIYCKLNESNAWRRSRKFFAVTNPLYCSQSIIINQFHTFSLRRLRMKNRIEESYRISTMRLTWCLQSRKSVELELVQHLNLLQPDDRHCTQRHCNLIRLRSQTQSKKTLFDWWETRTASNRIESSDSAVLCYAKSAESCDQLHGILSHLSPIRVNLAHDNKFMTLRCAFPWNLTSFGCSLVSNLPL